MNRFFGSDKSVTFFFALKALKTRGFLYFWRTYEIGQTLDGFEKIATMNGKNMRSEPLYPNHFSSIARCWAIFST